MTHKSFEVILADPPWKYNDQKSNNPALGGITYPVMSIDDLCRMPVKDIAHKSSILFMWATMPLLPEAIRVMHSWGFKYTTCAFVWVKLNPKGNLTKQNKDIILSGGVYSGLGHWVNGNAELVLMGKRGKPKRFNKNVKQIIFAPRGRHSEKPSEIYTRIENLVIANNRLELFARKIQANWTSLGNELSGDDIFADIEKLKHETSGEEI